MTAPQGQVPVTVRTFAQRFSATRRGARLARLLAVRQLTDWGLSPGVGGYDAAVLVVAELAANAVLHGRVPGRDFGVRLTYDERVGVLEIEVSDTHEKCPVPKAPTSDDEEGRGLLLVEALADRWGIRERRGPGKTVWARITEAR
ncbi:ATP-binding protein [Streptomyces violaceusniger]|uniref:ATP-binding region ATPase domain protein n=1 Tax=Streptomyces violaceusniger (strain Tu 4113) TaxID=653045 RepID=G2NXE3_STRV4|nr:ATP-binding protein [Streptomyces violaceusniger]AEM87546.1 ATP-binding region ATPase domain protein [Streptomyces violaceusniger Tu 4113]